LHSPFFLSGFPLALSAPSPEDLYPATPSLPKSSLAVLLCYSRGACGCFAALVVLAVAHRIHCALLIVFPAWPLPTGPRLFHGSFKNLWPFSPLFSQSRFSRPRINGNPNPSCRPSILCSMDGFVTIPTFSSFRLFTPCSIMCSSPALPAALRLQTPHGQISLLPYCLYFKIMFDLSAVRFVRFEFLPVFVGQASY